MPFIIFIRNSSEPFMDFSLLLDSKPHEGRDNIWSWYTLRAYWIFVLNVGRREWIALLFLFPHLGKTLSPWGLQALSETCFALYCFPLPAPGTCGSFHLKLSSLSPLTVISASLSSAPASSSAHVDQPSIWLTYFFCSHLDAVSLVTGSSECPGTHLVFLG